MNLSESEKNWTLFHRRITLAILSDFIFFSSSSRMRVMNHNWSATKQRLHPQSVAEISPIQFCQGTGFDNVRHRLGLATRTLISVCKSPLPSAGTQCPCSMQKRFSRDQCCRGRSKPGCQIVESHTK